MYIIKKLISNKTAGYGSNPQFIKTVFLLQDASGSISVDELLGLMRALGKKYCTEAMLVKCGWLYLGKNPTEEELLGLVMEVDIDGNGTIEFGEFIDLMRHNSLDVLDEEADLRMAFKMFDSNGDEVWTRRQFCHKCFR